MKTRNKILITAFVGVLLLGGLWMWEYKSLAAVKTTTSTAGQSTFRNFTFFASSTYQVNNLNVGTSTNATSTNILSYFDTNNFKDNGYFVISGAKRVTLTFARDDETATKTGTSTFNVLISPDGVQWLPYNKLISNITNTNTQNLTRVQFVPWAAWNFGFLAQGTTTASMDLQNDSIYGVACVVVNSGTGNGYCSATADW